jgi:hypothetical protein
MAGGRLGGWHAGRVSGWQTAGLEDGCWQGVRHADDRSTYYFKTKTNRVLQTGKHDGQVGSGKGRQGDYAICIYEKLYMTSVP